MKTVLICDDVQTDRELAAKVVTAAGHHPEFAVDGDDAITRAKTLKPDLILLDIVMPKSDGFAVCRALKAEATTQTIPIVFITSKATASDKFWGQKQGADEHIGKPFTPDALLATMKKFLG